MKASTKFLFSLLFCTIFYTNSALSQSVSGFTFVPQGEQYVVGGEFGYDFSPSSGAGLGVRGQKQIIPEVFLEAGGALSSGRRESNLFVSVAKSFYPDYGWQPALTLKGFLEFTNMDDDTYNQVGLAPLFSKGVKVVDQELYIFAGLPTRLIIGDDNGKEKRLSMGLNAGATGPLKFWQEDLFGSVELYFNVRKSYNSINFGIGKLF